jgi:hypothetical protein
MGNIFNSTRLPGGWRARNEPGATLSEAAVRDMWNLRGSIFPLKPTCDPKKDWEDFADWCAHSQNVTRVLDHEGRVQGMYLSRWFRGTPDGKPVTLVMPEYVFFTPELRRKAVFPWVGILSMLASREAFLHGPLYSAGFVYPSLVLAGEAMLGKCWFEDELDSAPHPALARWCMERVIEMGGARWDPITRTKDMPTVPQTFSDAWMERQSKKPGFQRYIARAPNWQQGHTAPVVCNIAIGTAAQLITGRLFARLLRRLRNA